MRFSSAVWVVAVLASAILVASAKPWDPTKNRYCGLAPHPEEASPMPKLPIGARFIRSYNFFRHGARTPTGNDKCFPDDTPVWNDCSNTMDMEPSLLRQRTQRPLRLPFPTRPNTQGQVIPGTCSLGYLLDQGLWQAYAQGRRLGAAFESYFAAYGLNLTLGDIDARSTDYHRTRATTIGVLTGVVDVAVPSAEPGAELPAIRFRDFNGDYMGMSDKICKSAEYIKEAYAAPAWVAFEEEAERTLRPKIDAITGVKHTDVKKFFDCAKTRLCSGKDIPDAYTKELDTQLATYLDRYWNQVFFHDHQRAARLFSGGLLVALYGDLLEVRRAGGSSAPRVFVRGGHDFGPMMNLVAALDIGAKETVQWPPYVSMLNLEVFVDSADELRVRAVHEGILKPIGICTVRAPDLSCSLDGLIATLEPMLPTAAECPGLVPEPLFLEQFAAGRAGAGAEARKKLDVFVQRAHAMRVMRLADAAPMPTQRSHAEVWAAAHDDL